MRSSKAEVGAGIGYSRSEGTWAWKASPGGAGRWQCSWGRAADRKDRGEVGDEIGRIVGTTQ